MDAGEIGIAREVHQPARAENPYFARALETLAAEGLDFLNEELEDEALRVLEEALRRQGFDVRRG